MIKNENTSISSVYDKETIIGKIMKGLVKVYESWRNLPISGIPPLTLPKCKGVPLLDYKIYGESMQNGTPTSEASIEVESVGEYNALTGKYKIPVKATSTIYEFNPEKINIYPYADDKKSGFDLGILEAGEYTFDFSLVEEDVYPRYLYIRSVYPDGSFSSNIRITTQTKLTPVTFKADGVSHYYLYFAGLSASISLAKTEWAKVRSAYLQKSTVIDSNVTNIYLDEPLRKIGDYADYIDFKKRKVVRNAKEHIFNGTESISMMSTSNADKYRMIINVPDALLGIAGNIDTVLSSHYPLSSANDTYLCRNGIGLMSSREAVTFYDENCQTVDTTKNFLLEQYNNKTPVTVIYPRTQTEESIELPNIPTFKGTTILEVVTTIQPSNMKVIYKGKR